MRCAFVHNPASVRHLYGPPNLPACPDVGCRRDPARGRESEREPRNRRVREGGGDVCQMIKKIKGIFYAEKNI